MRSFPEERDVAVTAPVLFGETGGRRVSRLGTCAVVVIPTCNEAENLPRLIKQLVSLDLPDLWILIVDDNSPDGTGLIAESLRLTYPRIEVIHRAGKLGLGTAYVQGFKRALDMGADYVIQMDADFSHDPSRIPGMLKAAEAADVVVGSRYVEGGGVDEKWGWRRRLLSAGANRYARTILRADIRDVTGGFRCMSRHTLERSELGTIRSNGYAFQIEMAHRFQQLCLRVVEHPIHFFERDGGSSKMSLQVMLEAAWRVWQFRFNPWRPRRK